MVSTSIISNSNTQDSANELRLEELTFSPPSPAQPVSPQEPGAVGVISDIVSDIARDTVLSLALGPQNPIVDLVNAYAFTQDFLDQNTEPVPAEEQIVVPALDPTLAQADFGSLRERIVATPIAEPEGASADLIAELSLRIDSSQESTHEDEPSFPSSALHMNSDDIVTLPVGQPTDSEVRPFAQTTSQAA